MRKTLYHEFTSIYHINLGGDVYNNPKLSGTTHNVFKIQVGVGITFLVRRQGQAPRIFFATQGQDMRREDRLTQIQKWATISNVPWSDIKPDSAHHWVNEDVSSDYDDLVPLGTREAPNGNASLLPIFSSFGLGVSTNRDEVVYGFSKDMLTAKVRNVVSAYNAEVDRWLAEPIPSKGRTKERVDEYVDYSRIKWSENLKDALRGGHKIVFDANKVRASYYRPFCRKHLYFDELLNDRRSNQPLTFPSSQSEIENVVLCLTAPGSQKEFMALAVTGLPDLHLTSPGTGAQCFPFYTYNADGTNRRENITDDALTLFRTHYADPTLTKRHLFAYIYALLHHPDYRTRYKENLKRELPRIPFAGVAGAPAAFHALADAGEKLLVLHTGYETADEYPLQDEYDHQATPAQIWRVDRMRLSKDGTAVIVNPYLTLRGIPPEAHRYRLGSRSALEWVIDQYRVKGESDPNRADEPDYIVRLVKRIVTVSVETVKIVEGLPGG